MENKAIDIFPKAVAILSSLLVFLGIIASVVYYRSFGINILEYITLGEALILFLSKFSSLSISAIFGVFLSKIFLESPLEKVNKDYKGSTQSKVITNKQKILTVLMITPLSILCIYGFSPFVLWSLVLSVILRFGVLAYILKRLSLFIKQRGYDFMIFEYIQAAGLSIVLLAGISMSEAFMVYNGYKNETTTLYCSNEEILQTNDNILYIGRSQLYYFLYNKSAKTAIVLKAENIEKMELRKNK